MLHVALSDEKIVRCEELYTNCPIQIDGHEFFVDLYKFELTNFDVIFYMDWLSKYKA